MQTHTAGSRRSRLHADRSADRGRDHRDPPADRVPELPGLHHPQQPPVGPVGARGARQPAGEDLPQLQRLRHEHDRGDRRLYGAIDRRTGRHQREDEGRPVRVLARRHGDDVHAHRGPGRNAAGRRRQADDQRGRRANLGQFEDLVAGRRAARRGRPEELGDPVGADRRRISRDSRGNEEGLAPLQALCRWRRRRRRTA